MRKVIDMQMKFGEVDIATIDFDPRSRDEIPKLLIEICKKYVRFSVGCVTATISTGGPGFYRRPISSPAHFPRDRYIATSRCRIVMIR
jgi:hypothetical protein